MARFRTLALAALAALALTACATAPDARVAQTRAELDHDMPGLLARHKVPSVSIAWIENGRIVLTAAYGLQAPGIPATPDTLYNVASMAKPVSAEIVLRLASRGRLSLDEPMYPYWVDPDLAADQRHKLLTPRIALSHRTGFPNWRFLTGDKLVFQFDPGTSVAYSGEGYEYVARFAERRTGTSFEALARELVFGPIGMKRTAYTAQPWFEGRLAHSAAADGSPVEPSVRSTYLASDDLHTTAEDYARFMVSAMNRERLTPAIARERERVQASNRARNCQGAKAATCPPDLGFGLGWDLLVYPDRTILWHTGADRGEFALGWFSPSTRDGAIILTNSGAGYLMILPVLERLPTDPAFLAFLRAQAGD